jgi:uncharacterized membrane protein
VNGRESDSTIPPTLLWAVRLLFLEAAGLAALAAYLVIRLLTASDVHIGVAVALIVMAVLLLMALGLLVGLLIVLPASTRALGVD